jgi:diacylglycerol kinase family enzyme
MTASAPPGSPRERPAVVYNPIKGNVPALKRVVRAAAKAAGTAEPLWFETTVDEAGQGLALDAIEQGATVVIAAGGDGTVRSVAEGLRGSGVALGIVPVGTGNLLARNLSLPLFNLEQAVAIALTGNERTIDVGMARLERTDGATEEHSFLVMAGLGLDAMIVANTSSVLKKRLGWLAYVESGLRTVRTTKPLKIRYRLAGHREHTARVSTILAGNCGVMPGGVELMPDARLDDGELDIAVLQPRTVFGWLAIWRKVTWENRVLRRTAFGRRIIRFTGQDKSTMLSYLRGPGIDLGVDEEEPVQLDGDELGTVTSVSFWADPSSLVVRV